MILFIRRIIQRVFFIIYPILKKLPLKENVIIFESYIGRSHNDSPRVIFEYLRENYPEYTLVWSVNNPKSAKIEGATVIRRLSPRYFFIVARTKYIINNSRMPKFFRKREDQVYVQTWHGTPLKRLVYDMETNSMPNTNQKKYLNAFSKEIANWDFLVSPNQHSTEKFRSAFKFEKEILEVGYPRNEMLHNITDIGRDNIRQKFGFSNEDIVILYTPTYRDNNNAGKGKYLQDIKLDLDALEQVPNLKVLLRVHYLVSEALDLERYDNIIDVSLEEEINELYIASDLLLTDYSSTMFDYLILNKPIVLYPYDLAEYAEEIRGFYFDYNQLPAEQIYSTERLIEIAKNLKAYKVIWNEEMSRSRDQFILEDEVLASKLIVERMFSKN